MLRLQIQRRKDDSLASTLRPEKCLEASAIDPITVMIGISADNTKNVDG